MTEIEPEVKGKKTSATEEHHGVECKYVIRPEMKNVNGKDRRFYYSIRSCHCGQESDHSNMLQVDSGNLSRMDGVEVHLKEDCKWVQPEMCKYWYIFKNCELLPFCCSKSSYWMEVKNLNLEIQLDM